MLLIFRGNYFFIDNCIVSDDEVDKLILSWMYDRIFLKLTSEGAARGVFVLKRDHNTYKMDGNNVTAKFLRSVFVNKDFFMEKSLEQEPISRAFNPDTVNTIHVLTLNNGDGDLRIVSAAVRFGRKGHFVDNMHAGGLAVSINLETGRMEKYGARRFDPMSYYEHPDSMIKFENTEIPQWNEIIKLVYKTLMHLPQYRSVGFDIVTTDDGPLILEINTGAGMDLAQVGKAYGIADAFKKYIKNY